MERPIIAASAAETPICAPKIHSVTVTARPTHIFVSWSPMRPISFSACAAAMGASGVSFSSGGSTT